MTTAKKSTTKKTAARRAPAKKTAARPAPVAAPPAPEPVEDEVLAVRIGGHGQQRNTENDHYPFLLGDDDTVLYGERPPFAVLLDLIEGMTDDTNPMAQARTFNEFLDEVLSEESAQHVRARMRDREDPLDLDHPDVEAMFRHLTEVWYGRTAGPTGGRGGSSAPSASQRTGRRSTGRAPSRG